MHRGGVIIRPIPIKDERLYNIWRGMHKRCCNTSHKHYKYYGGKGIVVCDEWMSFINFVAWALSSGYTSELTIDRIDINGNYEPSNCRWITMAEQAKNKSNTFDGRYKDIRINIRQRGQKYEYRLELPRVNEQRNQVSKSGFLTKEDAIEAAKQRIDKVMQ